MGWNGGRRVRAAPLFFTAVLASLFAADVAAFFYYQDPSTRVPRSGFYQPIGPRDPGSAADLSGGNPDGFKDFLRLQEFFRGRVVVLSEPMSVGDPWHWTHVALARVESSPRDRRMQRPLKPRTAAARQLKLRRLKIHLPRHVAPSRHDPWRPSTPLERVYLVPDGAGLGFYLVHENDLEELTFPVGRRRGSP